MRESYRNVRGAKAGSKGGPGRPKGQAKPKEGGRVAGTRFCSTSHLTADPAPYRLDDLDLKKEL